MKITDENPSSYNRGVVLIVALSLNNHPGNPMSDVLWPAKIDRKVPDNSYYGLICHCGVSRGAYQRMTTACTIASSEWTPNEGPLSDSKRAGSTGQAGQGPLGCTHIMTVGISTPGSNLGRMTTVRSLQ